MHQFSLNLMMKSRIVPDVGTATTSVHESIFIPTIPTFLIVALASQRTVDTETPSSTETNVFNYRVLHTRHISSSSACAIRNISQPVAFSDILVKMYVTTVSGNLHD